MVFTRPRRSVMESPIINYVLGISKSEYFLHDLFTEFWVGLNGEEPVG